MKGEPYPILQRIEVDDDPLAFGVPVHIFIKVWNTNQFICIRDLVLLMKVG